VQVADAPCGAPVGGKESGAERSGPAWRSPVGWWFAVAAFNVATAAYRGVWTTDQAARRWWYVIDDQIPELTARWFLHGGHFALASGGWHASDRGPVQPLLLLWAGSWSTHPVPAFVMGVLVNSTWVIGLWYLLRALDVGEDRIRWAVVLTALAGSIWVNTVYPWPKLLSGAFTLGCAAALLRRRPWLAGVLAALALLSHGSALFGVIALIPWAITRLGRRALLVLVVAATLPTTVSSSGTTPGPTS